MSQNSDDHVSENDPELSIYPDLLFWYPGLSLTDLIHMPRNILNIFIEALPRLQTEKESMYITGASFPHMNKRAQQKVLSAMKKESGKRKPDSIKPTSHDDVQQMAHAAGFAFEIVEKSEEGNASRTG